MMRLFPNKSSDPDMVIRQKLPRIGKSSYTKSARVSPRDSKCDECEQELTFGVHMLQFSYDISNRTTTAPLSLISEESSNETVEPAWTLFD